MACLLSYLQFYGSIMRATLIFDKLVPAVFALRPVRRELVPFRLRVTDNKLLPCFTTFNSTNCGIVAVLIVFGSKTGRREGALVAALIDNRTTAERLGELEDRNE